MRATNMVLYGQIEGMRT